MENQISFTFRFCPKHGWEFGFTGVVLDCANYAEEEAKLQAIQPKLAYHLEQIETLLQESDISPDSTPWMVTSLADEA